MTAYRFVYHAPCWLLLTAGFVACSAKSAAPKAPTFPVSVATAQAADVPLLLEAVGSVEPIRTVTVQAQIAGVLTRVAFTEGQEVHEGQTLFEIDARPYQAALQQMQGNLAKDLAQWQIAVRDVARYEGLALKDYVPQQQLDQARTAEASLAATLRSDSAGVERARLDLQYATIKAPISGLTGSVLLKEGNLVHASGEPLVVINEISPVLVRFAVPAQYLDAVRRRAGEGLPVRASPADVADTTSMQVGTLTFLDNAVDTLTSTLTLKANFPNDKRLLWPGAVVRVRLQLDTEHGAIVVPRSAVQSGQAGDLIWVVDSNSTTKAHKVVVERQTDSLAVIHSGIKAGETVVIDGQLRLTAGAKVKVRDSAADAATAANSDSTGGGKPDAKSKQAGTPANTDAKAKKP